VTAPALPKALPADAWRTWVREGTRLWARGLTSWGLVFPLVCAAFLWPLEAFPDQTTVAFLAIGGLFFIAPWLEASGAGAYDALNEGDVDLGSVLRAAWAGGRMVPSTTWRVRLVVAAVWVVSSCLYIACIHAWQKSHPVIPVSPVSPFMAAWFAHMLFMPLPLVFLTFIHPLRWGIKANSFISVALERVRRGDSLDVADAADVLAGDRNHASFGMLIQVSMGLTALGLLVPWLAPWAITWWHAVLYRMHADLFDAETLQPLAQPATRAAAVPRPA
jgi:hypothetical protein